MGWLLVLLLVLLVLLWFPVLLHGLVLQHVNSILQERSGYELCNETGIGTLASALVRDNDVVRDFVDPHVPTVASFCVCNRVNQLPATRNEPVEGSLSSGEIAHEKILVWGWRRWKRNAGKRDGAVLLLLLLLLLLL